MKHLFTVIALLVSATVFSQTISGTFLPTLISSKNAGNPIPQPAHYMQIDSEVFVYGHVFVNGSPTAGTKSNIILSIPIPSSLLTPPLDSYGMGELNQAGAPQPVLCLVQDAVANGVQIIFTPTTGFSANITYNYSYSIK